jgi:hypothetical protein
VLDAVLAGGFVVAVVGVLQIRAQRDRRSASAVSLLREGMKRFEGPEAEAVRAEFRRSGVVLPERRQPVGFP